MMWVIFLKGKSEAFNKFKIFKAKVETKSRLKLKCLKFDRGGELCFGEFNSFCEMHRIKRQLSAPKTPQQNGVVERKNRIVLDVARTMLTEGNVLKVYWGEAISTAIYTINRVHIKCDTSKTPYDIWFGHVRTVKYFKAFGRKCYIKRDEDIGKFDDRSDEGILLEYSTKSKAYR